MPTKYPGRYQSRLFRYLNRQYIRWNDRGDRAVRHSKVATTWGAQVLLYPFFVLFQSAQIAGRRLQQFLGLSGSPSSAQLPPADMPVRRVLELAGSFYLPEGTTENSHQEPITSPKPLSFKIKGSEKQSAIAGIATQPENRNLVLVNEENQILDILTPEQQEQLYEQISFEVATYWEQRHLIEQIQPPSSSITLAAPTEQSNVVLPVRLFKNLISWLKTGPIGKAVNLFQEETQLLNQFENRRQQLKAKSQELKHRHQELTHKIHPNPHTLEMGIVEENQPALIANLDRTIAKIETNTLDPVSQITQSVVNATQKIIEQVKTQFTNTQTLTESYAKSTDLEDPWLTTNDLFGQSKTLPNVNQVPAQNTASLGFLPPATQPDNLLLNSIQSLIKRYLQPQQALAVRPQKQSDIAVHQTSRKELTKTPSKDLSKSVPSINQVNANPENEWIETEAQPVGYVKHPLQQILELLDKAMLWLEELLIKAWKWLQRWFKNKN